MKNQKSYDTVQISQLGCSKDNPKPAGQREKWEWAEWGHAPNNTSTHWKVDQKMGGTKCYQQKKHQQQTPKTEPQKKTRLEQSHGQTTGQESSSPCPAEI